MAQVGDARLGSTLNNPVQSARDARTDRSARITQVSTGSDWGTPSFSTSGWRSASVGYSGERSDPVAGLDLFYSRGYDTRSGSWLSKDTWTGSQADPSSLNGYGFVSGNPITLRDEYGFRPIGQYDRADSTPMTRTRAPQRTVPQFTAPGVPGLPQPHMSSYSPSKNWNGTVPTPKVVTPKTTSQTTARHEDWWNPFSWSGDTWRNVGAVAAVSPRPFSSRQLRPRPSPEWRHALRRQLVSVRWGRRWSLVRSVERRVCDALCTLLRRENISRCVGSGRFGSDRGRYRWRARFERRPGQGKRFSQRTGPLRWRRPSSESARSSCLPSQQNLWDVPPVMERGRSTTFQ